METQPTITGVDRVGSAILVYFSDDTLSLYTAEELIALHAYREQADPMLIED